MQIKVQFLGGAGTVTGSKFYIETPDLNIMVECGLFQGAKSLRETNWRKLPIDVGKIDFVLLTHGHLDHVGYLPRLVKEGFKGKIVATRPTLHIAKIILTDSGKIQEELAEKANKEAFSRHKPALPLYTIEEARKVFPYFQSITCNEWTKLAEEIRCRFCYNGHIIGSTYIELELHGKMFIFSGDLGRQKDLLLYSPERPRWADYLFLESTYGDKMHPQEDVNSYVAHLIKETIQKRGTLIIPSFAVERLQSVLYRLWQLYNNKRIPNIPVFVDSPMGANVLEAFKAYPEWHKLNARDYKKMCNYATIVQSYSDTWKTIDDSRPKIVIAGSGMITGGRVLTYLSQLLKKESTTVLLVGYQAEGTRGRKLLEGATSLKIFGKEHIVKANVRHLQSLSAHADQSDLLYWLKDIRNIPEQIFLVHGEQNAMLVLQSKIKKELGWNTTIPVLYQTTHISIGEVPN